jgi:predicted RNA binding protein YcfA (HicA-like mRNA interferase family)
MKDRDLLKELLDDGWKLIRVNGSHHVVQKGGKTLSVPIHGKDVKPGLLHKIKKEAGLK